MAARAAGCDPHAPPLLSRTKNCKNLNLKEWGKILRGIEFPNFKTGIVRDSGAVWVVASQDLQGEVVVDEVRRHLRGHPRLRRRVFADPCPAMGPYVLRRSHQPSRCAGDLARRFECVPCRVAGAGGDPDREVRARLHHRVAIGLSLSRRGSSVANPKTAEIDKDLLKSDSVQSQVQQVEKVRGTVKKLQAGLDANMQVDLSPIFGKDLDTLKLRNSLNKINEVVVDEETQRGTDRLTRTIIQDVYELEASSKVKDGYARSAKKAASMQAKLVKLDESFGQYLAFFK